MQFKRIAFLTILPLILFLGCESKQNLENKEISKVLKESKDKSYPSFELIKTNGNKITLQATSNGIIFNELKDKAVLLNFFTTWSNPCKGQIPHLNSLVKKYSGKFEVIGVLLEDDKSNSKLQTFIKNYNVNYPITNSKENYLLAEAIGEIKSIPTMFLFHKHGKLLEKYIGMVPQEMMEIDIKKAIK